MTDSRPTLLFVHGAWHGSWCWQPVRELLEERGWATIAIDLPTIHSANKSELGLAADADSVSAAIDEIDGDVVVVAHSYGGVPVTQGATSARVTHIVYIAAFALDAGESLLGAVGGVAPDWWVLDGALVTAGTADQPAESLFFGDVEPALAASSAARLLPQSAAAFSDSLTEVAWRDRPTTYVITENDAVVPLPAQEALAARSGSAAPRLATSHSPFLSQPVAVADIVEQAARG